MMFPLNPSTVFHIVLIGVMLFSALALQFKWQKRIPLLLWVVVLPAGFLWSDPPTGQYAALAYVLVGAASAAALVLGAILGGAIRFARLRTLTAVTALLFAGLAVTGFELWRQYVPSACIEAPLQVRIAGSVLRLPSELRPRLENGDSIGHFGRINRKTDFARFCRMSRNGARAIDMDTVWITPATNHTSMSSTCNSDTPPAWCNGYSPESYMHIGKIIIKSASEPAFPSSYWGEGSLKKDRQGDLIQGSVCLLPDADIVTQCWAWRPFGDGARLTVSTNNLDSIFKGMPIEEAREMIRHARDTTLAIIIP